jgi:hypothetical protein
LNKTRRVHYTAGARCDVSKLQCSDEKNGERQTSVTGCLGAHQHARKTSTDIVELGAVKEDVDAGLD